MFILLTSKKDKENFVDFLTNCGAYDSDSGLLLENIKFKYPTLLVYIGQTFSGQEYKSFSGEDIVKLQQLLNDNL